MKPVAIITALTAWQNWLIYRRHERRTHFAIHRFGGAHSNGQIAWLADGADCARDVGGIDLCRGAGTSAQSRAVAGYLGFGIFTASEKRVVKPVRAERSNGHCNLPCGVCQNSRALPFSAYPVSARATDCLSRGRAVRPRS